MQQLHGFEATLVDLSTNRKEIHQLRDDLVDFNLQWIDRWLEQEYQGLQFADDWGSQTGLLISPDQWRSFFKPAYAAMFAKTKAAGCHVWFHSDGNITDILPDLVELGVDVLNCQAKVMDMDVLRSYAGRICFRTDLDRQSLLPYGTPQQIRQAVHELFDALGTPGGGIVANGDIDTDVPLENIRAMYEAFLEYKYA